MAEQAYDRPLPEPDVDSQPFWDALREHKLRLQSCADCNTIRHPPAKICPRCLSERAKWIEASGKGTIYTYVVVTQPVIPSWTAHAPYNVVQVLPEEIPESAVEIRNNDSINMIYGNLIESDLDKLVVGLPVEAVFDDVTEDTTLLKWKAAER